MNGLEEKWDGIYRQSPYQAEAAKVLSKNRFLLPEQGKALDLACGLGGNALLLAEAGLTVDAWDISGVALQALQVQAALRNLNINIRQGIITQANLPNDSYDVVVISRFLDRNLCNAIMATLNTGGLLFYQTFTRNKLDRQGPNTPDYLLATNELLRLFTPLTLIFYEEYARVGNLQYGNRNEACLIGQKPLSEPINDRKP